MAARVRGRCGGAWRCVPCTSGAKEAEGLTRRSGMYPNPNEPVRPVEPVQPAQPAEYRRDIVQTDETSPAFSIAWIIYIVLGIVVGLIIIRVLLKALAAN